MNENKADTAREILVDRVASLEKTLHELGGIVGRRGDTQDEHGLRLERLERETGLLEGRT